MNLVIKDDVKVMRIETEIWCRTCGYYRPVKQMSAGKRSEFHDRINYKLPEGINVK